jgi:Rad3-related DNA helicase
MSIDENTLKSELELVNSDFTNTEKKIRELETVVTQLKGNLNALHGAKQQLVKLIEKLPKQGEDQQLLNEKKKPMPAEKAQALQMATT